MKTAVVLSDEQVPSHDRALIDGPVKRYLTDVQPDWIIHNGDFLDFPDLSTKYKRKAVNRGKLVQELDEAKRILKQERKACPNADIILLPGNHEERLYNLIEERAEALEPLISGVLSLECLLDAKNIGVKIAGRWSEGTAEWERNGLVVTHGEFHGANAARRNLQTFGSVIFGHVHKHQVDSFTNRESTSAAWSPGALCNAVGANQPPGVQNHNYRNVQQGFATVFFGRQGYTVYSTLVVNGGFIGPNGKEYRISKSR